MGCEIQLTSQLDKIALGSGGYAPQLLQGGCRENSNLVCGRRLPKRSDLH